MKFDLQSISTLIIQLGIVCGVISAAYKLVDKHIIKRFINLDNRLKTLETNVANQHQEIKDESVRDRVLLDGVRSCLRVLNEIGHDADVERAMSNIDNFMADQAFKFRNG